MPDRRTVVVDTDVLINFAHASRFDLLSGLTCYTFAVPHDVIEEVKDERQRELLHREIECGRFEI